MAVSFLSKTNELLILSNIARIIKRREAAEGAAKYANIWGALSADLIGLCF